VKPNSETSAAAMPPIRPLQNVLCRAAAIALLAAALSGCQSFGLAPAAHFPADGIALQSTEPVQGTVDAGNLTLSYAYAVTSTPSRQLHLSGRVNSLWARADSVTVYLHILDSAGRVMETSVLYASGYKPPTYLRRPSTFDTTLNLPSGAAAIAFSSYIKQSAGHR